MRRTKTSGGISPQQLRHFAFAAVAITGLLALFASGEDWGAKAQVEAVETRNSLKIAQAEKFGKRVETSMTVRKPDQSAGFGEAAGVGPGGGDAASAPSAPNPVRTGPLGGNPALVQNGDIVPVIRGPDGKPMSGPPGTAAAAQAQKRAGSPEEIDRLRAASRARSGSSGFGD